MCVCVLSPQACGPQYGYMCGHQQYISGVCANVSSSFQILNSVAPGVQGTQRGKVKEKERGGNLFLRMLLRLHADCLSEIRDYNLITQC